MQRPVALCHAHRIEIALATVPALLLDQLAAAQQESGTLAPRADLVATARAAVVADLLHGVHGSVVYFLANGGRVKIGYTTNLKSRLASLALRNDSVLLVLHGGPDLERALHSHFGAYRDGTTEWFELAPEVFRFIAAPHPATAATDGLSTAEGTVSGVSAAHIDTARQWLSAEPHLTGAAIGTRLAKSDSYGRRVKRVALGATS
jgi:hypothetical protein